jgi:hypothetical protein
VIQSITLRLSTTIQHQKNNIINKKQVVYVVRMSSYTCNAEELVSSDLNSDGVLDESEFNALLLGDSSSSTGSSCPDGSSIFDFSVVGCRCLGFRFGITDDEFGLQPVPILCRADCSVVPLADIYLESSFPGIICQEVTDYWITQGCIDAPTNAPSYRLAPTAAPSIRGNNDIAPTKASDQQDNDNGGDVATALLGALCALLLVGLVIQFILARRTQRHNEEYRRNVEQEQQKQETIARRKKIVRESRSKPFQPVLGSLQENSNGTLVLTPTNLPPEESILRCSLKFPDKMTPKIFFATSITIESLKGGRQYKDQELTKTEESGVEHVYG